MNYKFETYIHEHMEEMLCQAEKEHALAQLRKAQNHHHEPMRQHQARRSPAQEIKFQDCAIAPDFSLISL